MKRLALLLVAALTLAGTAWAQGAGSPTAPPKNLPPGAPSPGGSPMMLTPSEWQELRAARSAALAANPDLMAENQKLMERMHELQDKLNAAMVKADPTIAPIIARFQSNRPPVMTPPGSPAAAAPAPGK